MAHDSVKTDWTQTASHDVIKNIQPATVIHESAKTNTSGSKVLFLDIFDGCTSQESLGLVLVEILVQSWFSPEVVLLWPCF